jgi:hypothetical protein
MENNFTNDFSITRLFASEDKDVRVFVDKTQITLHLKTIRDLYEDEEWLTCYSIITRDDKRKEYIPKPYQSLEPYNEIKTLIFELGLYSEYKRLVGVLRTQLESFIQDLSFDFERKEFVAGAVTITADIWNYLIYVLKLSCGEKEKKPMVFTDEASKQLYLAQLEMEKRVNKIKNGSGKGDDAQILKMLLSIIYQFPSLTLDYLFNQTMAQIHWLYGYAMKSVSYEVTSAAYTAGNLKKGTKLHFFTEN